MKKLAASLFAVLALAFASTANATPIQWNLSGVTLSDSTSVTGSFFYDATTHAYSNWSLTTTSGTLPGFTYSAADSSIFFFSGASELWTVANDYSRYLNLNFASALTGAGGSVALTLVPSLSPVGIGSWESNNNLNELLFRSVTAGSVVSANFVADTQVPEPSSIALLGLALAGLSVVRRKRA